MGEGIGWVGLRRGACVCAYVCVRSFACRGGACRGVALFKRVLKSEA